MAAHLPSVFSPGQGGGVRASGRRIPPFSPPTWKGGGREGGDRLRGPGGGVAVVSAPPAHFRRGTPLPTSPLKKVGGEKRRRRTFLLSSLLNRREESERQGVGYRLSLLPPEEGGRRETVAAHLPSVFSPGQEGGIRASGRRIPPFSPPTWKGGGREGVTGFAVRAGASPSFPPRRRISAGGPPTRPPPWTGGRSRRVRARIPPFSPPPFRGEVGRGVPRRHEGAGSAVGRLPFPPSNSPWRVGGDGAEAMATIPARTAGQVTPPFHPPARGARAAGATPLRRRVRGARAGTPGWSRDWLGRRRNRA